MEPLIEPAVFRLELPLRLAPPLNSYASMKRRPWALGKLNAEVDGMILAARARWHSWKMDMTIRHEMRQGKRDPYLAEIREGGRRRHVRLFRYSSVEPDELSVDVCGGKLPVDRLKLAEVIRDDNRKWLQREAHWLKARPKEGRVVIEIFDLKP